MNISHFFPSIFRRGARDVEDLEEYRDITDDVIEADFAPYACLGDPHTIYTKNGEVLQIIRIDRLEADQLKSKNLRQAIRHALSSKLPDASYAFWLHTFRREKQYLGKPDFQSQVASELYDAWHESHRLARGFTNELYLTIVKAGEPASLRDPAGFLRSLNTPRDTHKRMQYITEGAAELGKIVDDVLELLGDFGATRLGLETREDGVVYGEHLEFLEKLINLEARPMPVAREDLSHYLTSGDVTFGFNAMEVRTAEGKRRFATIMTVKEYKEVSLLGIDEFLEIPCELIVTQNFDFVGAEEAKEAYDTQAEYLRLSGDKELWRWAEFDKLLGEDTGEKAFGRQQTSLFLIAPSVKQLEETVKMVRRAMAKLGMLAVREDLRLEEMYWAQLPANFPFVARSIPINTQHLAGFVKLQHPPKGCARPGVAEQPVMMMRTADDSASYFGTSFADTENQLYNHLAVIAGDDAQHRSFAHLLFALSSGIMRHVWCVDLSGHSKQLVQALGGSYQQVASAACPVNPFAQSDSSATREFLALWCAGLLGNEKVRDNKMLLQFFHGCAATVLQSPGAQRSLTGFQHVVAEEDAMLASQFNPWVQASNLHISGVQDGLQFGPIAGFDLSHTVQNAPTCAILTGYLLHRMTAQLDGTPSLIMLDEGAVVLANHLFKNRIGPWLDYLTSRNVTVMVTVNALGNALAPGTLASIMQKMGQRIYFSSERPDIRLLQHTYLSENGFQLLDDMPMNRHLALYESGSNVDILQMDMRKMPERLRRLLAGVEVKETVKDPTKTLEELMGIVPTTRQGVPV